MLCRGLFTPGNEVIESKFQHHVHTAAFPPGEGDGGGGGSGGYPLADAFAEVGLRIVLSLSPLAESCHGYHCRGVCMFFLRS